MRMQQVKRDCFFFNDTATTEIYTLSLHDALPISRRVERAAVLHQPVERHAVDELHDEEVRVAGLLGVVARDDVRMRQDRKSTRLNSSHANISYAVFCLKKKNSIFLSPIMHPLQRL